MLTRWTWTTSKCALIAKLQQCLAESEAAASKD